MSALLATLLLVTAGCGLLDNDPAPPDPETFFTATLNGEPWTAEVQPSGINSEDYFDIVGIRYSETSFWNEQLVFSLPFRGTGSYSLVWGERQGDLYGASFFEVDGDARLATYYPLPDSATNYVRVTSYDPDTGIMKGRFRTTVVVSPEDRLDEPGEPPRRRADTLRFTDGSFRVIIEDRR